LWWKVGTRAALGAPLAFVLTGPFEAATVIGIVLGGVVGFALEFMISGLLDQ
jgi:hypothetical protein